MSEKSLQFYATYTKTIYRDERLGYTVFAVTPLRPSEELPITEMGTIGCSGVILPYGKNMPLHIIGEPYTYAGKTYVRVQSCKEMAGSEAVAVMFLSGPEFDGVGEKTAEKIVNKFGADIFALVNRKDPVKDLMQIQGMTEYCAKELLRKLRKYTQQRELMEYCAEFGGTYRDAASLSRQFGAEAMDKIQKAPYLMTMAGVPYFVCETIAARKKISKYNDYRLTALVFECIRLNESAGNTYMSFAALCQYAGIIERVSGNHYQTEPFALGYCLQTNPDYFEITKDQRIYRKTTYDYEKTSSEQVSRLMHTKKEYATPYVMDVLLSKIEAETGVRYGEDQRKAFELMKHGGISVITGGPGTGKSTLINGIIQYCRIVMPRKSIALCAPTGAAAKRLREATGMMAQTIHKLIDIRPFGNYITAKDEYDPLAYDIVIVDEVSMVDTELFCRLLRAIKNESTVLLVGDKDQLPSVGCGNVLRDLIKCGQIPVVYLNAVFRQEKGNSIIANSIRIRNGDTKLINNRSFEIWKVPTEEKMKETALRLMDKYYDVNHPFSTRFFTPVRKRTYEISTFALNRHYHEKYHGGDPEAFVYGGTEYSAGEPVVMKANNYDKGYMNGDTGIITRIDRDSHGAVIEIDIDGEIVDLRASEMADVELGYATTTHKAQGSECDTAIVLVPEKPANMLERSLVYVACTRAKRKNILIVQNSAMDTAIATDRHDDRKTGLAEMVGKAVI